MKSFLTLLQHGRIFVPSLMTKQRFWQERNLCLLFCCYFSEYLLQIKCFVFLEKKLRHIFLTKMCNFRSKCCEVWQISGWTHVEKENQRICIFTFLTFFSKYILSSMFFCETLGLVSWQAFRFAGLQNMQQFQGLFGPVIKHDLTQKSGTWKMVRIRTHDFLIMSFLPYPLDHGASPKIHYPVC